MGPFLRFFLIISAVTYCLTTDTAFAQIVALGASNTQGYGVSTSEAFPAQLEAMLHARGSRTQVKNAGVFGDASGGMLSRLSSSVPDGTRTVILQIGGNDVRKNVPVSSTNANIAAIRQQLKSRGITVIGADGYVVSALRSGLAQADGIHLTAAGHRKVASQLLGSVK
jgi:acyl-CoA thioesterase-1